MAKKLSKNNIDYSKLARQEEFIETWVKNYGIGCLEAVTAFGKTYTTMLLIKKMLAKNAKRTFVIVVPTIQLKDQWDNRIEEMKFPKAQFKVFVINGLTIRKIKVSCSLLVLDEVHLYINGEIFSQVFDLVDYKFILGLSATIDRSVPGYSILHYRCPIIDTITQQEANAKGWVAEYKEFVLSLDLDPKEREELETINNKFKNYFSKFNYDFQLAMSCLSDRVVRLHQANRMGWKQEFGKSHPWSPDRLAFYAVQFNRAMQQRKAFLYDIETKKQATVELIQKLNQKAIVFAESTTFADEISDRLGDTAISYHSNIESETRKVKNKKGETVLKKFGKTRLKTERLKKFEDNRSKIKTLSTARALNQGADLPSAQLAVIASYTSSALTSIQRRGRVIRKFTDKDGVDKKAVVVYLAIKDSQEEKWLKKALSMSTPTWTNSIDYIVENAFTDDFIVQQD